MRTTRTLAIAAAFGLGVYFVASANVIYDSETTNSWFGVNMSALTTADLSSTPWSLPPNGGEATVVPVEDGSAKVIRLDTDLDDPLTYTAGVASTNVAVVAAEMTATVNATEPQIDDAPQAALAVIGTAVATNWVGLVGKESGGTEWVTFNSPAPVAGETYSVRIEFDQRPGEARRIRYLVEGAVLGDGWYPNPKESPSNISSVSFSGSGDIAALDGENIAENTVEFRKPTETEGFDFTNGTIEVSADIRGYESVTATLTIVDFDSGYEKQIGVCQLGEGGQASWDLSALTAGGTYGYTIEAKDVGGKVIASQAGTFTAAKWPTDIWFGADASKSEDDRELNGSWDQAKEPAVVGNVYVIEDDALFNVSETVVDKGTNHVTRVDAVVTFESLVDSGSLGTEENALGGFVAATVGAVPTWMALTARGTGVEWVALSGDVAPEANVQYVVRAEIDFQSALKRVRYLVSTDGGTNFAPLALAGGAQWMDLADANKKTLAKVELKGSGSLAKFEARIANKAVAKVGEKEYDSMDAALAAAKDSGTITLLTNATVEPTEEGKYEVSAGVYYYVSGGKVAFGDRTIIVEAGGKPVVRPSDATMRDVKTPDGRSYKNYDSLRKFLERNKVGGYTNENADAQSISNALEQTGGNRLPLWQNYALGVDQGTSVEPVTIPTGDTSSDRIILAIPAVDAATPSDDYDIAYEVVGKDGKPTPDSQAAGAIKIPLGTGTYRIKAVFTPKD